MRREFSKSVKRAAFIRSNGKCDGCTGHLYVGHYHYDHIIPDALGGEPTEANCQVLCTACHGDKTAKRDVPTIAKTKRISDRHNGIRTTRQKIHSAGFRKAAPQHSATRPIERKSYSGE